MCSTWRIISPHVFTPSRLTVLKLLASQAAIALENARLAAERQAHLWFLESLERVRAMQGTNDLEQMMGDVLDAVLAIFHCDRAWVTIPHEPDTAWWRVVMERTGQVRCLRLGRLALRHTGARTCLWSHRSRGVPRGAGRGWSRAMGSRGAAGVRPDGGAFPGPVLLAMALYPKGTGPTCSGCTSAPTRGSGRRRKSGCSRRSAGRLPADALTGLLMFRSLRESERRLDEAQRIAHVGYWDRDLDTGRITLSDEACRSSGCSRRSASST